jgi:hypothetical protein
MVNMWGYANGAIDGTPLGISNWAGGEGSLTVSGPQGSTSVTINSVNVGVIGDYAIDTPHNSTGWAVVIQGDDGIYRVYSVSAVDTVNLTLSIYPALEATSTSTPASNFYDMYVGPHLTTLGFYGLADFVVAQTKGISYLQKYAARYVSDGLGNYSGANWTAIGGLNQGQGGLVPPTNCMTQGVYSLSTGVNNIICNAYSGADRTAVNGSYFQTAIGAALQGQGAKLTANLNGRSGYLDTFVGIEGQYQSQQASARVQVYVDGALVLNQNFGGLTHINVPFTHAQAGEIDVTVDSPYPCAARISNTSWYVWDDTAWNGVSPGDPLIPNGSKVLILMDSWGVWHNAAFVTRLAQDLPGSSITNVSQDSQTALWAIQNFSALTAGGPYDYIISSFQINDLEPGTQGISFAQLLANLETFWNLVLNTGATPIYIRSLTTAYMPRIQSMNEWDQTLTTNYPTQIESQGEQEISFPNPGVQTYGTPQVTLTATASSGLPVTYMVISGPASVSGNIVSLTGIGSVTIQASQSGNSQWLAAPSVNTTFAVTPATLTVTADNQTMTEGGTFPTFTYTMTGFVNGDTQGSATTGQPSLTTDAPNNPPVGTYNIFAALGTLTAQNYTFTFVNGTLTVTAAVAQITSPPKNSALTDTDVAFVWTHESGATAYQMWVGATPGGKEYGYCGTSGLTCTLSGLPSDGSQVYATLYGYANNQWTVQDNAQYTAVTILLAQITSPPKGSTLNTAATFTWTAETGATSYQVWAGSVPGADDLGYCGTSDLTCTISGLPDDGSPIYVTLYGYANSLWTIQDTGTYNATTPAQITSPPKGSTLPGASDSFTWSAENGATSYQLWVGSTPNSHDIDYAGTSGLQASFSNLPTNGQTIYVTLYGYASGVWSIQDTGTYTAATVATAQITSPAKGSMLPGDTVTFTWTAEAGATSYQLWAGSAPGLNDLGVGGTSDLTVTLSGLPTDGSQIYVTLYGYAGDVWSQQDTAQYTAFSPEKSSKKK